MRRNRLTNNRTPAAVFLKRDLARSVRRGHPWVYRDAVTGGGELPDGAPVQLHNRDGRPLARGFWDASSPIAVRLLESGGPKHRFAEPNTLIMERLRAALDRRLERLDLARTNAFRWVHGEGDLLPGIHIDVYAGIAVVRFDGGGARAFYEPLESRLRLVAGGTLPLGDVIDRDDRQDSAGQTEREVLEDGLRFSVDLAHGQKGGLFLDQRENRARVAALAREKSVLDLFGYTGGFSVQAAANGARCTDTVDLARPAMDAARHNFALNRLSDARAGFHVVDAFAYLTAAVEHGDQWDIVVSDPPSFAPRQHAVPGARRAYERLHRLAASVTRPGGWLCASSCSSHFDKEQFLNSIDAGARRAGRRWIFESLHGAAFDHPVLPAFPEGDYLKFAVGRVL